MTKFRKKKFYEYWNIDFWNFELKFTVKIFVILREKVWNLKINFKNAVKIIKVHMRDEKKYFFKLSKKITCVIS